MVGKTLEKKKRLCLKPSEYSKDFLLESVEAQPVYFLLHTVLQITNILALSTTIKDPMTHKNLECSATDTYCLQSVA